MEPIRALLLTTCTPDDTKVVTCVRSLRRAGVTPDVAGDHFWGQAYWSRAAGRRIRLPHPKLGGAEYIERINQLAPAHGWRVLLPLNDYTMDAVIRHRRQITPQLAAAVPEAEAWDLSKDKFRIAELARNLGIGAPLSFCPASEAEALEAGRAVGYPCVIKPRRGCGAVGRVFISSPDELLNAFRKLKPVSDAVFDFERLVVQQFIDGEPEDVCAIFRHGEPVAAYTQRKIRTWPLDGGRATVVETTHNRPLLDLGLSIMRALRWHGAIQTEFRIERSSGKPYLIDVNGRFWGALGLAVAARLDFPVLYCKLALGEDLPPAWKYPAGVRFRWPVPFALLTMLGAPHWLSTLREFFQPAPATFSDLSWSDPAPVLAEHIFMLRRVWQRVWPAK